MTSNKLSLTKQNPKHFHKKTSLSELTSMIFNMELTHLDSESSIFQSYSELTTYHKPFKKSSFIKINNNKLVL